MKLWYAVSGVLLLFVLALGVYFLLLTKKLPISLIPAKPAAKEEVLTGWKKVWDYYGNYPELLQASEASFVFSGQVEELTKEKLSLSQKGKRLTFDLGDNFSKILFFESLSTTPGSQPKKISFSDIQKGDTIEVNVTIDLPSGKQSVIAIFR